MARVYQSLGATKVRDKVRYAVYSFARAEFDYDQHLLESLAKTESSLSQLYSYRFSIFEPKPVSDQTGKDFDKVWVGYDEIKTLLR